MIEQTGLQRTWWQPQTMEMWDVDNAVQALQLHSRLDGWTKILKTISVVGSLIMLARMAKIGFTAFVLAPTSVLLCISIIGLYCLGRYLQNLAQQHIQGLTDTDRHVMSVAQLKDSFDLIPSFRTDEELQNAIRAQKDALFKPAREAIAKANGLQKLVSPLYDPLKNKQPRFLLHTEDLNDDEIEFLLNLAHDRGIILELSQLFFYGKASRKDELTHESNIVEDFGQDCANAMVRGFNIQVKFLMLRFQAYHLKGKRFDVKLIQQQLKALGFKWENKRETRALRPNIEVVNEDTIVVRGNFSEIPNPIAAVADFAPYVKKIKMPHHGILNLEFWEKQKNGGRWLVLSQTRDWDDFKMHLQEVSGNKMYFIEHGEEDRQHRKTWQDDPPFDPSKYNFSK